MLVRNPNPKGEESRRRQAAIAFADVAGYSILTAADESGTHERWMALFRRVVKPEAARVGGRIVGLHGDGVLGEFDGADAALEWARALHAASLATQQSNPDQPPIAFRDRDPCRKRARRGGNHLR
jgi:adenylate cyclase